MSNYLTRREFFSALAASVVAAGCPLPIGFSNKVLPLPPGTYEAVILDIETRGYNSGMLVSILMNGRVAHWRLGVR